MSRNVDLSIALAMACYDTSPVWGERRKAWTSVIACDACRES